MTKTINTLILLWGLSSIKWVSSKLLLIQHWNHCRSGVSELLPYQRGKSALTLYELRRWMEKSRDKYDFKNSELKTSRTSQCKSMVRCLCVYGCTAKLCIFRQLMFDPVTLNIYIWFCHQNHILPVRFQPHKFCRNEEKY